MADASRSRTGVWAGRFAGATFVLVGLGAISGTLILWIRADQLAGIDLIGLLMVWIGVGLIRMRDSARKAGVAVAVLHVGGSTAAMWTIARASQDRGALTMVTLVAALMTFSAVILLMPATREAFRSADVRSGDDDDRLTLDTDR